jgi:hypothetical protein
MSSLIAGATLKPAEQKPRVVETRTDLLSAIKKGRDLKHVDDTDKGAKPQEPQEMSVAAILSRRIAIADSSDDEGDSFEDSWD